SASGVALGSPSSTNINVNCGVGTVTHTTATSYAVGTNAVVWTVTDGCGNTGSCTQKVIVVDNQAPTMSCPADVTVNTDSDSCSATGVALSGPSSTNDNCAVSTVANDGSEPYVVGTNAVVWTVTDVRGNSRTCTQTVYVVDNETPSISCPADVTV